MEVLSFSLSPNIEEPLDNLNKKDLLWTKKYV